MSYPRYYNRGGYRQNRANTTTAVKYDRPTMPEALVGQGFDFVAQPARFPNDCRYCGIHTDDWCVGVRADREYYVVCNACAASLHHQVLSFVSRIDSRMDEAAAANIDVSPLETVIAPHLPMVTLALSAAGTDEVRRQVLQDLQPVAAEMKRILSPLYQQVEALRSVMEDLPPRDRSFAESLVQQFDRTGNLSERQAPYLATLTAKAQPVVSTDQSQAEKDARKHLHGLHLFDGHVYRVDEDGTLLERRGRRWYTPRRNAMPIINEMTRITQEKAQKFGLETGLCCNCGRNIGEGESRRSIAVGYGPDCASRWGWYYPTEEEAERMLKK